MPAACTAKHSRGPQLCRAYLWLHLSGARGDVAYSPPPSNPSSSAASAVQAPTQPSDLCLNFPHSR